MQDFKVLPICTTHICVKYPIKRKMKIFSLSQAANEPIK